MEKLGVAIFLAAGLVSACTSTQRRADTADNAALREAPGGWRCPYDIEERDLVEARISIWDKYDAMIPEIAADLRKCVPRIGDAGGELAKYARIVNAYGLELETSGWEDMDAATVANEKYWQSLLSLASGDITTLLVRLLLLMREGMLARADLVSFFCYLDRNPASARDARIGRTAETDARSIALESNRLVEEGVREFDNLNTGKALELYRRALIRYPKNHWALYEIGLSTMVGSVADMAATGGPGDPQAITGPADPYYGLVRHLAPLYRLAYQGTMTPELRKAAAALLEKVLPSYEKIGRGEDVLANMRILGDGFYEMQEYELALYAYKFVLFHACAGDRFLFEGEVVERISGCLVELNMEQLVPFLQELLEVLGRADSGSAPAQAPGPAVEALLAAAGKGDCDAVMRLLSAGADVSAAGPRGRTALMDAAYGGHAEAVRILLEAGAEVNAAMEYGWTALGLAAKSGKDAGIIRMLLEAGADTGARVECPAQDCRKLGFHAGTPLLQACMTDCEPAIIRLLIAAGSDLEARDEYGYTPLLWAAVTTRNAEVLRLLLEAGADVEVRDAGGRGAIFSASVLHDDCKIFRLLLEAGADVNARGDRGWTPLVGASMLYGNPELVRMLIRAGADVNARDEGGRTVLMLAAAFVGNPDIVSILLNAGADAKLKDDTGRTVLDYAARNPALRGTPAYRELEASAAD